MKPLVFCLLLLLTLLQSPLLHAQGFIIGADRLHFPDPTPDPNSADSMRLAEWDAIQTIGLNAGSYSEAWPHPMTKRALDFASSHGVRKVVIVPAFHNQVSGQRWKYHPEYDKQYSNTGTTGELYLDQGGIDNFPATKYPQPEGGATTNCKSALVGTHNAGTLCHHLRFPFSRELAHYEDKDWHVSLPVRMHVRVRLRLAATENSTKNVLRVTVTDSGSGTPLLPEYTITTSDSIRTPSTGVNAPRLGGTNSYGEVYAGSFVFADTSTVDIQVSWPGEVNVYVDYIALDDTVANELFGGVRNGVIDSTVSYTLGPTRLNNYQAIFNAPSLLPSGVYTYMLRTPLGTATGRMLLAR